MKTEWYFCHFKRSSDIHIFLYSKLLPENRNCSTYLHMRKLHFTINCYYLFLFNLISNISIVINASCIITCSSSFVHSSRNKSNYYFNFPNFAYFLSKISLNKWCQPFIWYLLSKEIFIEIKVPEISLISRNNFNRVTTSFLHPFNSSLSATS
jgi:hypothetical protein